MNIRVSLLEPARRFLLGSLVAAAPAVFGQATLTPARSVGEAPPAAASPAKADVSQPKLSPEARKVLDRAGAAYHALKTYQDFTDVDARCVVTTATGQKQSFHWQEHTCFASAGPRRFTLRADSGAVYGHDQTFINQLRMGLDDHGKPSEEKEVIKLAPDGPIDWADCMGSFATIVHPTPVHAMLMTGPGSSLDLFLEAQDVKPGELDERPGFWVSGKGLCPYTYGSETGGKDIVPVSAWFSAKTGLLREIDYDFSRTWMARSAAENFGASHGGGPTVNAVFVVHVNGVATNEPLDDSLFVYSPTAPRGPRLDYFSMPAAGMGGHDPAPASGGASGVKPASAMGGMTPATALPAGETIPAGESQRNQFLGKRAPAFVAKTPEGKDITLADFKDKVILLDVWATWCGPCMQAIPAVQRVSEHFKNEPVAVVGINRDKPSDDVTQKVRKVLERKGITFNQVMDQDGAIAKLYKVTALPTLIIIDRSGVIRAIHVGSGPVEEELLTGEIDKVLKGQPLEDTSHAAQ